MIKFLWFLSICAVVYATWTAQGLVKEVGEIRIATQKIVNDFPSLIDASINKAIAALSPTNVLQQTLPGGLPALPGSPNSTPVPLPPGVETGNGQIKFPGGSIKNPF